MKTTLHANGGETWVEVTLPSPIDSSGAVCITQEVVVHTLLSMAIEVTVRSECVDSPLVYGPTDSKSWIAPLQMQPYRRYGRSASAKASSTLTHVHTVRPCPTPGGHRIDLGADYAPVHPRGLEQSLSASVLYPECR